MKEHKNINKASKGRGGEGATAASPPAGADGGEGTAATSKPSPPPPLPPPMPHPLQPDLVEGRVLLPGGAAATSHPARSGRGESAAIGWCGGERERWERERGGGGEIKRGEERMERGGGESGNKNSEREKERWKRANGSVQLAPVGFLNKYPFFYKTNTYNINIFVGS